MQPCEVEWIKLGLLLSILSQIFSAQIIFLHSINLGHLSLILCPFRPVSMPYAMYHVHTVNQLHNPPTSQIQPLCKKRRLVSRLSFSRKSNNVTRIFRHLKVKRVHEYSYHIAVTTIFFKCILFTSSFPLNLNLKNLPNLVLHTNKENDDRLIFCEMFLLHSVNLKLWALG